MASILEHSAQMGSKSQVFEYLYWIIKGRRESRHVMDYRIREIY